jgi:hypothetical protein
MRKRAIMDNNRLEQEAKFWLGDPKKFEELLKS